MVFDMDHNRLLNSIETRSLVNEHPPGRNVRALTIAIAAHRVGSFDGEINISSGRRGDRGYEKTLGTAARRAGRFRRIECVWTAAARVAAKRISPINGGLAGACGIDAQVDRNNFVTRRRRGASSRERNGSRKRSRVCDNCRRKRHRFATADMLSLRDAVIAGAVASAALVRTINASVSSGCDDVRGRVLRYDECAINRSRSRS